MIPSTTFDSLKDDVLNELDQLADDDYEVVAYYREIGKLELNVVNALNAIDKDLSAQFATVSDLYRHLENGGSHLSLDRIENWDVEPGAEYEEADMLGLLHGMMPDVLPMLLSHQLMGSGIGLWELFDHNLVDINYLV